MLRCLLSARRSHLVRHREGIRAAFELADRIDALRLLFGACPVGPPALRTLARLEEELAGLVARHGGRVAVRIRRLRGMAIPGPGTGVLRLPRHLAGGALPARWWGFRAWLDLPDPVDANKGDLTGRAANGAEGTSDGEIGPERPTEAERRPKIGAPPSIAELSLADSLVGLGKAMGGGSRPGDRPGR